MKIVEEINAIKERLTRFEEALRYSHGLVQLNTNKIDGFIEQRSGTGSTSGGKRRKKRTRKRRKSKGRKRSRKRRRKKRTKRRR